MPWDWSWGNRLGAKDRGLGVPPPTDTCYKALCDLQVAQQWSQEDRHLREPRLLGSAHQPGAQALLLPVGVLLS